MTAILLFLRGVPVWVWLALGLLGAGLFYGHLRHEAGEAKVQALWDADRAAFAVKMAEAEAAVVTKSQEVRSAYDAGVLSAANMKAKEISDAYTRGKTAGQRIAAGTDRVRPEWRDYPAPAEGEGSGPVAGAPEVSRDRAEAIGEVLAIGGVSDATYAEAYRRLEQAQKVVNACYESPAQ